MAHGGRVYNGIDKKLFEWRIWGWRIGMPTGFLVLGFLAGLYLIANLGTAIAVVYIIIAVVIVAAVTVFFNRVDPYKRLTETSVAVMVLRTLTRRDHDTL